MWIKLLLACAVMTLATGRAREADRSRAGEAVDEAIQGGLDPAAYRARGPEGLAVFLADHAEAVDRGDEAALAALDAVCAQRHCRTSRLFWFTDLEAAKARARAEKKPILSLHLLGRLDEQLSCANSRFFRKLLYADPTISAVLRERFVLHWKTVRPVPKVTVDFGDGRTMVRTLTGNSAHYVLDADGRPLDVLPGLFTPRAFHAALVDAEGLAKEAARAEPSQRSAVVEGWHRARLERVTQAWGRELRAIGVDGSTANDLPDDVDLRLLELATRDEHWDRIAGRHRADHRFSEALRESIAVGAPDAWKSGQLAVTKAVVENPVLGAVRRIEWTVGRDSIRNEYARHGRIHAWFAKERAGQALSLEVLNARVYSELFAAPLDDPWYGLGLPETFEGLDDGVLLGAAR